MFLKSLVGTLVLSFDYHHRKERFAVEWFVRKYFLDRKSLSKVIYDFECRKSFLTPSSTVQRFDQWSVDSGQREREGKFIAVL